MNTLNRWNQVWLPSAWCKNLQPHWPLANNIEKLDLDAGGTWDTGGNPVQLSRTILLHVCIVLKTDHQKPGPLVDQFSSTIREMDCHLLVLHTTGLLRLEGLPSVQHEYSQKGLQSQIPPVTSQTPNLSSSSIANIWTNLLSGPRPSLVVEMEMEAPNTSSSSTTIM